MTSTPPIGGESAEQRARDGFICALIAYLLWGLLPLYFLVVKEVTSTEVLVHRIIWAVPFGAIIILARRQWPEVIAAFVDRKMLGLLIVTAILIAANWLVYIWATQNAQIFQASLGYYINPLLFAAVGVLFMGEPLRKTQATAIALAAVGVTILTISGGQVPAIALFLGVTFTVYGVMRKRAKIGGMPGLFVETLVLVPFAVAYLIYLFTNDAAAFSTERPGLSTILLLAGPITVVPLLMFALAAQRLNLATLGMMQFIAPTMQFVIGVYTGEALSMAHIACMLFIWTAVIVFSVDAWRFRRRTRVPAT